MQTNESSDRFANETQLEKCHSYILRQLQDRKSPGGVRPLPPPGPAITISHQTGAGAHEIAERLAELLQPAKQKEGALWTVFDRNLVEQVLEEHHLPKALAKYMPEDRRSYIKNVVEEFVGLRPPSWAMVPQVAETILHLADAGHVILVGRGASFITMEMPNVFHVRLIASQATRIERLQKLNTLTPDEAKKIIARTDRGRRRYVKAHFHASVEDELSYHLIINTDRIPYPEAARIIADAARICLKNLIAV